MSRKFKKVDPIVYSSCNEQILLANEIRSSQRPFIDALLAAKADAKVVANATVGTRYR
jgi:hypothetical protein